MIWNKLTWQENRVCWETYGKQTNAWQLGVYIWGKHAEAGVAGELNS